MRKTGEQGWIVAIAAVLAASAFGVILALLVFLPDQPKPTAPPTGVAIKIDPAPLSEPTAAPPPPVDRPVPARSATSRRKITRPAPTAADPDPVTIETTNSW